MNKYLINLDLHGGDFAPNSVLEGANIAKTNNPSINFNLHSEKSIYEKFKPIFLDLFDNSCLLYTSPSPRDSALSRMPSSA